MKEGDTDILSAVIETEREIQAALDSERKKAREWVECVRAEEEHRIAEEEERLKAWAADALTKSEAEAMTRAEAIIRRAENISRMLSRMDDDSIRRLLSAHLTVILPEEKK